jgi:hypothetical protein
MDSAGLSPSKPTATSNIENMVCQK